MVVEQMIEVAIAQFKQNLEAFCVDRDWTRLTPDVAEAMASGIKQAVAAAGVAAYRTFVASYEVCARSVVVDGEEFRFKFTQTKEFMTFFGPMILARNVFQNKTDTKTHVPLDAAWDMEGEFMTVEVREAVLMSCAHMPPEEAVLLLHKCALSQPHATAIKHVVYNTGERITQHKDELDARVRSEESVPDGIRVFVTSLDGVNVLLREKGVKMGRPAERPTGDVEEQTPTTYKNAMVGSSSYYGLPQGEDPAPPRLCGRYTAHMPEAQALTFKRQFEAEVEDAEKRCGPEIVKVVLLDGARALWNYVDNNPRFEGYQKLVDYWHAVEHLSKAAEALFGKESAQAKTWFKNYRKVLLEDDAGVTKAIRSMAYYCQSLALPATRQKDLTKELNFFRNNRHRMAYAYFRRQGWPIGSGPVEAACKSLVKTRLCRSGMRWSRKGGQHILNLRTYVKSGRWDEAWKHIRQLPKAA